MSDDDDFDQYSNGAYAIPLSDKAQDLPMAVVTRAADIAHTMHVSALSHAIATIAEPDHPCGRDGFNIAEHAPVDFEVTDADVQAFLYYEESMDMVFRSMRRYLADKGYPELALSLED